MTIVGKILVFLNFLFALATVYMIVLNFQTREAWRKEYLAMRNVSVVAEDYAKRSKVAQENEPKGFQPQLDAALRRAEAAEKELAVYKGDLNVNPPTKGKYDALAELNADLDKKLKLATTNHDAALAEIGVLRKERDTLIAQAEEARGAVLKIQQTLNLEMRKSVENKIEADSYKQKAERMLVRVEDLEKKVTTLTNQINALGPLAGKSSSSLLNPPPTPAPRDVYGTVKAVGTTGLTVISLGSDSGISAGNKLEIYRIDEKNPRNSIYLGELVISRTEPKQAVGQFYPKPYAKPEERLPRGEDTAKGIKGDIVSTGLGSK